MNAKVYPLDNFFFVDRKTQQSFSLNSIVSDLQLFRDTFQFSEYKKKYNREQKETLFSCIQLICPRIALNHQKN